MIKSSISRSCAQQNQSHRTDNQWLISLRGQMGPAAQQEAIEALGNYLHVVAYNYLCRCRANSEMLTSLESSELGTLAEDHVHTFMEKLIRDDFSLLAKYDQRGRFTTWAAAIQTNLMVDDMRRAAWRKQVPFTMGVSVNQVDERTLPPDLAVVQNSVLAILYNGISELPKSHQVALTRCLLEGEAAKEVAKSLEVTPNAVYMLVHRAKENLRQYLIAHDVDRSVVCLFA